MGFRFHRTLNFGKGLGLNASKSGVSPTYIFQAMPWKTPEEALLDLGE